MSDYITQTDEHTHHTLSSTFPASAMFFYCSARYIKLHTPSRQPTNHESASATCWSDDQSKYPISSRAHNTWKYTLGDWQFLSSPWLPKLWHVQQALLFDLHFARSRDSKTFSDWLLSPAVPLIGWGLDACFYCSHCCYTLRRSN